MIGCTLGHYQILEPLGAGGMGEVYRARDERLEREVAIKVLPTEVADDPHRLARFELEAKALARLSHPNILTIHDFGREGEVSFAVTELLKGQTLREMLRGGALPWRRAVEIGAAIADGLAAAHAEGIVHRDLKPENVFVTSDGLVKVLDFGIAHLAQPEAPVSEATEAATLGVVTAAGTVLGTAGYMAPEQVRGQAVDHRTDIFSLGCVLYDMLSGTQAFGADTPADSLSAILTTEPAPLSEVQGELPQALVRGVQRCLEKRPEDRFQDARDLAFALREVLTAAEGPSVPGAEQEVFSKADTVADDFPSVAVLPFANLSAHPEQEYFCDGMAEEIINALAQVAGLRVVARTSSFAFKGQTADVREIGDKLDVGTVLEGSVRKAGDRLRITAQLVSATDGYHLWSERFDRRLEDVFEIQDEIALAIVERLEVELLGNERAAVIRRHTENLDAHNAYLAAVYEWNKMSPEGIARCQELFREAIDIDPEFAPPYARLADSYTSATWWTDLPPTAALEQALPLVKKALAIDPSLAHAHSVRGTIGWFFLRDREEGESSLRRAVELAPNDALAQTYLGLLLVMSRREAEASERARVALRLDPLSPAGSVWAGTILLLAGHPDEGLEVIERQVGMTPHFWMPRYWLSYGLARTERIEEARAEAERALELSGDSSLMLFHLASICYRLGEKESGDALFDRLSQRAHAGYVSPMFLCWLHLARGEPEAALHHAEQALAGNDPWASTHHAVCPTMVPPHPLVDDLFASVLS